MKTHRLINILSIVFLSTNSFLVFAGQNTNPSDACNFLNEERFRGNMEYSLNERSGIYSCTSLRRNINRGTPSNSDLLYSVRGDESSIHQISLLLRMNSHRVSVPVVREFVRIADIVYQRTFDKPIPEKIRSSMLSSLRGEWPFDGYIVKLDRRHDRARTYELDFIIEFNSRK